MKSTEFRLKNLVWNDVQNLPCEVDFKILNDIHHGINDWKPIVLTDEWLIRFGFEKKGKRYSKDWFYLWDDNSNIVFALAEMEEKTGTYLVVKYVHQLQNLYFALTGEELTLNHVL